MDAIHSDMITIARIAAEKYREAQNYPPTYAPKFVLAERVKDEAQRLGILASDGTYLIAVEAIDAYEDITGGY